MTKPKKDKRNLWERLADILEDKIKDADLSVILKEGLYIGLVIDLAALTGRFEVWHLTDPSDPLLSPRGRDTFLTTQRTILLSLLRAVRDLSTLTIPLGVIPGLGDVAPFRWATAMLDGWVLSLLTIEPMPAGSTAGHGQRYWKALHPLERVLITLMLPGILRVAVQSTRQLIQLIK